MLYSWLTLGWPTFTNKAKERAGETGQTAMEMHRPILYLSAAFFPENGIKSHDLTRYEPWASCWCWHRSGVL